MITVSVCLPSDALPSYLGFSYLGHGVSLHGCSGKVQLLLLTLDEGYLLTTALTLDEGYLPTATPSDLECGVAPLSPPVPMQHRPLDVGLLLLAAGPYLVMIDIHHFIFYIIVLLV